MENPFKRRKPDPLDGLIIEFNNNLIKLELERYIDEEESEYNILIKRGRDWKFISGIDLYRNSSIREIVSDRHMMKMVETYIADHRTYIPEGYAITVGDHVARLYWTDEGSYGLSQNYGVILYDPNGEEDPGFIMTVTDDMAIDEIERLVIKEVREYLRE